MTFVTEVRGVHFDFAQCERGAGFAALRASHTNPFTASMKRIRLIGLDT